MDELLLYRPPLSPIVHGPWSMSHRLPSCCLSWWVFPNNKHRAWPALFALPRRLSIWANALLGRRIKWFCSWKWRKRKGRVRWNRFPSFVNSKGTKWDEREITPLHLHEREVEIKRNVGQNQTAIKSSNREERAMWPKCPKPRLRRTLFCVSLCQWWMRDKREREVWREERGKRMRKQRKRRGRERKESERGIDKQETGTKISSNRTCNKMQECLFVCSECERGKEKEWGQGKRLQEESIWRRLHTRRKKKASNHST